LPTDPNPGWPAGIPSQEPASSQFRGFGENEVTTEAIEPGDARPPDGIDETPGWPDDALVQRAQNGDRAAFDALYTRYAGRVYALCLRMAGSRAEAERLAQDTFVRAWQRLDSFRGESAFGSWLHRIAVNAVLEDARRERRRTDRIESVYDIEVHAPPVRSHVEDRLDLERAIATLPPGARAVLVLHDIEGYTHDEIGAMLGIAAGTAKAQLHRARRLLRGWLER
jgi:RNA polymerase sigma-70 factor (ECF subfamily)